MDFLCRKGQKGKALHNGSANIRCLYDHGFVAVHFPHNSFKNNFHLPQVWMNIFFQKTTDRARLCDHSVHQASSLEGG